MFPLHGRVLDDIKSRYKQSGGNLNDLPKYQRFYDRGIKYLRYFIQPIFQLPFRLTLYKSFSKKADGDRGVIADRIKSFVIFKVITVQVLKFNQSMNWATKSIQMVQYYQWRSHNGHQGMYPPPLKKSPPLFGQPPPLPLKIRNRSSSPLLLQPLSL